MKNDFSQQTHTVAGYEVKDVKFNSIANKWLGLVKDPKSITPDKFTTCSWNKLGKCNPLRPDCFLK